MYIFNENLSMVWRDGDNKTNSKEMYIFNENPPMVWRDWDNKTNSKEMYWRDFH
jgi:hypothetical protein